MSIGTRLDKLEHAAGAGACEACGAPPPGGKWPRGMRFTIDTNPEGRPFVPEFCPGCGRQVNFTLPIGTAGRADE